MLSSIPTSGAAAPLRPQPARQVEGLMQRTPLLISTLIEHAALYHSQREVVSRLPELGPKGASHRTNYAQIHGRSKKLANALTKELGVSLGTVVGTLAFNTFRHLEAYYGVSGCGAILHTINPRLFLEQLEYIINHAEDHVLLVDGGCVPVLLQLLARGKLHCKNFVMLVGRAQMPTDPRLQDGAGGIRVWCCEELLARHSDEYVWPVFDENTASSLCYTSGTTGNPKGVLYSHRSTVLHTMAVCARDVLSIASSDSILAIVPLFHANAWGVPYAACITGAKLVLPGVALDGKSVYDLIRSEQVTFSFGVPTVFLGLFQYLDAQKITSVAPLERVVIGGAAPPRAMISRLMFDLGVRVIQGWGMTEMSPLGTVTGLLLPQHQSLSDDEKLTLSCKAGRVMYGVAMKVVDDDGRELPRDGKSAGELLVAGPWITRGYYKDSKANTERDGYFKTGDISTLDQDGYMSITDRSKDVIKSGGEWISSIDLENEAANHPQVAEAAVIGLPHPKYTERPLLVVVKKAGSTLTASELLSWLAARVAKWWVPEAVEFVEELPHTATGKLKKIDLRKKYKGYTWPMESGAGQAIKAKL